MIRRLVVQIFLCGPNQSYFDEIFPPCFRCPENKGGGIFLLLVEPKAWSRPKGTCTGLRCDSHGYQISILGSTLLQWMTELLEQPDPKAGKMKPKPGFSIIFTNIQPHKPREVFYGPVCPSYVITKY